MQSLPSDLGSSRSRQTVHLTSQDPSKCSVDRTMSSWWNTASTCSWLPTYLTTQGRSVCAVWTPVVEKAPKTAAWSAPTFYSLCEAQRGMSYCMTWHPSPASLSRCCRFVDTEVYAIIRLRATVPEQSQAIAEGRRQTSQHGMATEARCFTCSVFISF